MPQVQPHDAEADRSQDGMAERSWGYAEGDEPEALIEKHRGRVRINDGIELDRRESASPRPADHVGGEGSSHAFAPCLPRDHQAAGSDVTSRTRPVRVHVGGTKYHVVADRDDGPRRRGQQPASLRVALAHGGVIGERLLLGDDVMNDRPDLRSVILASFTDRDGRCDRTPRISHAGRP